MPGCVSQQINRANWKLLLANGAMLAAMVSLLVSTRNYLHNAFQGPFSVDTAHLLEAMEHPDPLKQYLVVDFGKTYDTGFWWEERHRSVTSRFPYRGAWVNGRFLLIQCRNRDTSNVLVGRLRQVNDSEFHKVIQAIEATEPRLRGKLPAYVFDAHTNYFSGAYPLCGICGLLSVLAVWNVLKATRRIANPKLHPAYAQLAHIGNVQELEAQIDAQITGQVKRLGRCRFTRDWILQITAFGFSLMRIEDIVWLHKKVVRHYHNGIPTGKTYAAILHDRHGGRIEIPAREGNVDQLLVAMSQRAPWAFVGFLSQTQKAWKSDRTALIFASDERRRMMALPPAVAA